VLSLCILTNKKETYPVDGGPDCADVEGRKTGAERARCWVFEQEGRFSAKRKEDMINFPESLAQFCRHFWLWR
jgi:hypothetical protein